MIFLAFIAGFAHDVAGRVIDPFGDPIADVYVGLYDEALRLQGAAAVTGSDGRFVVQDVPTGRFRARFVPGMTVDRVEAWYPGDAAGPCDGLAFPVDGDVTLPDVGLWQGVRVTGRVVTIEGLPVSGALVEGKPRYGGVSQQARRILTDSDGRYELVGLAPDRPWTLWVEADGFPPQFVGSTYVIGEATQVSGDRGEALEIPDAQLLPGITVGGQVSGPNGPLERAVVSVYSGSVVRSTRSDALGNYEVGGLPPGDVIGWVDAEGHARAYWPDRILPGERVPVPDEGDHLAAFDIRAETESIVEGRLAGAPDVAGVNVLLVHESGLLGLGARTDAEGAFTVTQVPAGTWSLSVRGVEQGLATGFIGGDETPTTWRTAAGERLSIEAGVTLGVMMRGRVHTSSGLPARVATVTVRDPSTDQRWTTDVAADGTYFMGGLPAGPLWDVWAEGEPICQRDPDLVRIHYVDTPDPMARRRAELGPGERLIWDVELPDDRDGDGMGDDWEETYGFPVAAPNADDDPDGDGLTNLDEYWMGTDPLRPEGKSCRTAPPSLWWMSPFFVALITRRRTTAKPRPGAR